LPRAHRERRQGRWVGKRRNGFNNDDDDDDDDDDDGDVFFSPRVDPFNSP
jgi:phosphopantothenoylcysteine synthetase/decarboxylase